MFLRFLIVFAVTVLSLGGSGLCWSHHPNAHPAGPNGEIHSHELGVAITCASPPYYYLNGDDGGQEWALVSAAFDRIAHPARALYLPLSDALRDFRQGWLDAVWVCGNAQRELPKSWHWSEPLISRRFAAITLAESDMAIQSIADLSGKRVGIYPEVSEVLGDSIVPLRKIQPPLQSIGNHALLLLKLFTHRIDVLIAETSTFEYFRKKLPSAVEPERPVVMHQIFPPMYPRLLFRDAILRDEFNAAWVLLSDKSDGKPLVSPSISTNDTDQVH